MKVTTTQIRNFSVAGHSSSGKTSLCDLMLYKSGAVERLGKTADKTSMSDYMPDEHDNMSSIYSTPLHCEWRNNQFFFIDTPGYGEFIAEPLAAISSSDSSILILDVTDGLQIGFTRAWKIAKLNKIPRAIFINGMDHEMADYQKVMDQLQETYGKTHCIPITIPDGNGSKFTKVSHILRDSDIPVDAEEYREQIMDTVAESDETLMMRYLDGEKLSEEEISNGLKQAVTTGALIPVFAGSVEKDIGVEELMNGIVNLLPNPLTRGPIKDCDGNEIKISEKGPGIARVFKSINDPYIGQLTVMRVFSGSIHSDTELNNINKESKERFGTLLTLDGKKQTKVSEAIPGMTIAVAKLKNTEVNDTIATDTSVKALSKTEFPDPVMSYSISPAKNGDEEKIGSGLNKIAACDPTVTVTRHPETHQQLLSGMGDRHLSQIIKKLQTENKVEVLTENPKVPYRETITSAGEGHYRHKKQTGGHGQFAEVYLKITPNDSGYEFVNEVVGGSIPRNFIPAVEKGVLEAMIDGPLAGCHVENIKVTVYDGKHHDVDSSEMAFKIAGRTAFREAMEKSRPILLEPIQDVKVTIPDQYMGDISGDLNHKRGRILGMEMEDGLQVVKAEIPLAEMSRYATELRSITQGKGSFEMHFSKYEMVPTNVAKQIIKKHKEKVE